MTDSRLRELERQWKETGDVSIGARWLGEQVRSGGLAKGKLDLAAYLGHEAAQEALRIAGRQLPSLDKFRSDERFDPNPFDLDLEEEYLQTKGLVRSLGAWGWEPLMRATIACARLQIALQDLELRDEAEDALAAATAFLRTPSAKTTLRANATLSVFDERYRLFADGSGDQVEGRRVWLAGGASWFAAESAAQDWRLQTGTPVREPIPAPARLGATE